VVGDGLWRRRFGADPAVVGRAVRLNGQTFTVAGVAPPGFRGLNALAPAELWVPLAMRAQLTSGLLARALDERRGLALAAVGRLAPGAGRDRAAAELSAQGRRLAAEYPADNEGRTFTLVPLAAAAIHPNVRPRFVLAARVLAAVAAAVLLIACANVANLQLARAAARETEFAVRLALGAPRGRLVRQLLVESLLLGLAGGAAGLALGVGTRRLLWLYRPPVVPADLDVGVDAGVLAFVLALALATGLLFGLAPALQSTRADLVTALRDGGAAPARRRWRVAPRDLLLIGQVALSLVALVGAILLLRSLRTIQLSDPGFATERLLVVSFDPGSQRYPPERGAALYRQAVERVGALPGVVAAAVAERGPLDGGGFLRRLEVAGAEAEPAGGRALVRANRVDPGYFAAAGVPVVAGRPFTDADREGAPAVAVVNRTMADRFWPGGAAGGRFGFFGEPTVYEIVGVAADAKYGSLGEEPQPYAYLPLAQQYATEATLHVATAGPPDPHLPAVVDELRRLAPDLVLFNARTAREILDAAPWGLRLGAVFLGLFAALASLLAALGVFGVTAYGVAQRRREIAVRVALGARRADVSRLVVRQGMVRVGAGLALGLVGAALLARSLSGFLFGAGAADPVAFGGGVLLFLAVALAALAGPARRAMATEPVEALRGR
jgi:predicted permease